MNKSTICSNILVVLLLTVLSQHAYGLTATCNDATGQFNGIAPTSSNTCGGAIQVTGNPIIGGPPCTPQCQEGKMWNGGGLYCNPGDPVWRLGDTIGRCIPNTCTTADMPRLPENAAGTGTCVNGLPWKQTCNIQCKPGYKVQGESYICDLVGPSSVQVLLITTRSSSTPTQTCVVDDTNEEPATCALDQLNLSQGLEMSVPFSSDNLNYYCSCLSSTTSGTVTVIPHESTSTLSLQFNGQAIDGFVAGQASSVVNFDVGVNTLAITVSNTGCHQTYSVQCTREPPSTGGQVLGDPMFTGLQGQEYQVHGVAGAVYNLLSASDLQVNSRFVFLTEGRCPIINGKRAKVCFAHPGSYLGEIGLKSVKGDKIQIVAGTANDGFRAVTINDQHLDVGRTVSLLNNIEVTRNSTHLVTVSTELFTFQFENSDLFINQQLQVNDWSALKTKSVHGLLGQTWSNRIYKNSPIKYIEGIVDDYAIAENHVFGDSFRFNRFKSS